MIAYLLSKLIIMVYGMLYPAYCSYKAVKTKDVKEYVHWMMYWVVFSIFSVLETFSDTFIGCWFPFYYELKILFMIWMLSPTTRGGSILYRRVIHPFLSRHEPEIDAHLAEFKLRTSNMIVQWGSKAFSYITDILMSTALKAGAGDYRFMNKVSRTYSYENIDQTDMNRNTQRQNQAAMDEGDSFNNGYSSSPEQTLLPAGFPNMYQAGLHYGSVNDGLSEMTELSKPYSMMNLSGDNLDTQAVPKLRSSNRKKKEFGNFPMVTAQDTSMPLVFGWYPPNFPAPFVRQSFQQGISQVPFPIHDRNEIMLTAAEWVNRETFEEDTVSNLSESLTTGSTMIDEESDLEGDGFFDCESIDKTNIKSSSFLDLSKKEEVSVKPNIKVVSKTVLHEFEEDSIKMRLRSKSSENKSQEEYLSKRKSMTPTPSSSKMQSKLSKPKVKKSLSNSDLKLTKAPIISSSSFRRVFSPFSPVASKAKITGTGSASSSRSSSNANLSTAKDKK